MILTTYLDFRNAFKASPTVIAADGMPEFQPASKTFRPITTHEADFVTGITMDLTGGVNDASAGVPEWFWWLSDPGSATGNPKLQLTAADPSPPFTTRSGRVKLSLTPAWASIYTPSAEAVHYLLNRVHLYAFKIADNETYWSDLHRCAFAPNSFAVNFSVIVT